MRNSDIELVFVHERLSDEYITTAIRGKKTMINCCSFQWPQIVVKLAHKLAITDQRSHCHTIDVANSISSYYSSLLIYCFV